MYVARVVTATGSIIESEEKLTFKEAVDWLRSRGSIKFDVRRARRTGQERQYFPEILHGGQTASRLIELSRVRLYEVQRIRNNADRLREYLACQDPVEDKEELEHLKKAITAVEIIQDLADEYLGSV